MGAEIWILGSGPSLDDYPLDFFDDKISIAMKWCGVAFPNCTYNFCSYNDKVMSLHLLQHPELLAKQIFTLNPRHRKDWLGKYKHIPIYMPTLKPYSFKGGISREHIEETIKHIMTKESCRYAGIGLIQGWTIEAALVLGAKYITLAGCDASGTKFQHHAKRLSAFHEHPAIRSDMLRLNLLPPKNGYSDEQLKALEKIYRCQQTEVKWLAEMAKSHSIKIRRYFFKRGYVEVV